MRAVRAAVGAGTLLMVDASGSDAFWTQGYKWALRTAQMLASYDVVWFEKPLQSGALDDFVRLRAAAPLPISGGEVLTRRQVFAPWLQAGAFYIVQPDVSKVGGINEVRRIALNHTDTTVETTLDRSGVALMSGDQPRRTLQIEPFGVAIVESDPPEHH